MKILIVDDNAAIQEILRDILAEAGHNIYMSSRIDDAASKVELIKPDIVFIDSSVNGSEGVNLIIRHREQESDVPLAVILIKTPAEQTPKDMPEIVGSINKPFKSEDIFSVLDSAFGIVEKRREEDQTAKKKLKIGLNLGSIFNKQKPVEEKAEVQKAPTPDGVVYGQSYVIFEQSPVGIYMLATEFDSSWYDLIIVSSNKPKAVWEHFNDTEETVITLSANPKAGSMDIRGLGSLMTALKEFVASAERPVAIIDNFSDILEANGVNSTLVFLNELVKGIGKDATIAVSVNPNLITEKDKNILQNLFRVYRG